MERIPFDELRETLARAMRALGLTAERAELSARLIAETDLDGVSTHGVARFPRFAEMIRLGRIDPEATPVMTASFGALERWSGRLGPGNLAAHAAMARAIELAEANGMGGVALGETTHWQRGGTYGWQAATAGFAAICWSNTMPNLPPWGASVPAIGNNPLVIAVPNGESPIVLDMAMSQFSFGTLANYRERGERLPMPGGFDRGGCLTDDPGEIEETQRALPIGFWKGSGLAFVLDVLGAMLAGGKATHQITADPLREVGQSQVFLAFRPEMSGNMVNLAADAIAALQAAKPVDGHAPLYPGQSVLEKRALNGRFGISVHPNSWQSVLEIAKAST